MLLTFLGSAWFPVSLVQASSQPYLYSHGVNFGTGNKYQAETDIRLAGTVNALTFKRYYNSQGKENGVLGYGWTPPFGERLLREEGRLVQVLPTGRHISYYDNGQGGWTTRSGKVRTITSAGDGYQLVQPDGTIHEYNGDGKLTEKRYRNDISVTYTYEGELLASISDTFGRSLTFGYNDDNRLETIGSPLGTFRYAYDANDNLTSVTRPDGKTRQYLYADPNDVHNLTGVIDEAGTQIQSITYDSKDRVIKSAFADNDNQVTIQYQANLKRVVTDSLGVATTYQLESRSGVVRVQSYAGPGCSACGSGTGSAYTYTDRERLDRITDAKGHVTAYGYDAAGKLISKIEAAGTTEERATAYTYDPAGNRVLAIGKGSAAQCAAHAGVTSPGQCNTCHAQPVAPSSDPDRFSITFMTYDTAGNMTSRTESGYSGSAQLNLTTSYTYDSLGRVTSVNGPRTDVNDVTASTYYPDTPDQGLDRGNLRTVTDALGHTTTYSRYNAFGQAELIVAPAGTTTSTYDSNGRLLTRESNGITTSNTYDDAGRLLRMDLPGSRFVTYTYTPDGKVQTVTDSLGNSIAYAYDTNGNRTMEETFDPQGELKQFVASTYEQTGELDKTVYPDNSFEDLDYDPVGNLASKTDAASRKTTYTYDALDRQTSMTEPGGVVTRNTYDNHDNLTGVTDAEGHVTIYEYDDFKRRVSRTSPDTGTTQYTYDPAGNLLSETDAKGITKTFTYDALSRVLTVSYPDASQDVSYTYDENGHLGQLTTVRDSSGTTVYSYDEQGRLITEERTQGDQLFTIGYGYNDNSELTSITYPSGRVITYQRSEIGQVTAVTATVDGTTSTLTEGLTYLPYGPLTGMTLGNGLNVANSYNQLYRLTSSTAGAVYNREYSYYVNGTVQAITDHIDPSASQSFTYDNLDRLTAAQGKYGAYAWSYDNIGNRRSETLGTQTSSYSYEPETSRLARVTGTETLDYFYDAAGNLTDRGGMELTWDQNNRLTAARVNADLVGEYGYDSRNLRTEKTVAGRTTYTVYDRSGNLLMESDDQGNVLREFAYLNGTRINLFDYTANPEFYVDVTASDTTLITEATVYAFDEHDLYTGLSAVTDAKGAATFTRADFGQGEYTFRVDYLGGRFSSTAGPVRRIDRIGIEVPVEQVTMTVTLAGGFQAGVKVYVYTADGQYLGIFGLTDENGNVLFTLAEGVEYLFSTEILGNEYWSGPLLVGDGGSSGSIETGGGLLTLGVGETDTLPLAGLATYLYNGAGEYLGLTKSTNDQGQVSYLVPAGDYKIRVDYLGYQLWSDDFHVTGSLTGALNIPHRDVQIFAGFVDNHGTTKPVRDIAIALYTPAGTAVGLRGQSDNKGQVLFHVPELAFKAGANYLGQTFWGPEFTWQNTEILIETGTATVTVTSLGEPLRDVPVTVLSASGQVQDLTASTSGTGEAQFQMPAGTYLFRADYQGHQYLSCETQVVAFGNADQSIEVGGGSFVLTVRTDSNTPLTKVPTTLFTASGIELNSYQTDRKGQVAYNLVNGNYKIRIDYLGYSYWTEVIDSPAMTALDQVIAHQEVTVAAARSYLGDHQPLKNVNVQLWTPDGKYLKVFAKIGKDYLAHFSLPEKAYVFKVAYLEQLFASEALTWSNGEVTIPEGMAEVTLASQGTPLAGVTIGVYSPAGVDLGLSATTSAQGQVSFRLPVGSYRFLAEYNLVQYWATGTVIADQVTELAMNAGGGTITLTVQAGSTALSGLPCGLYDATGVYQNQDGVTDSLGRVSFDVGDGSYVIAVDYLGAQFQSEVYTVPGTLSSTLVIDRQSVAVTVTGDDGVTQAPLSGVRCALYTEAGIDTGVVATTDAAGIATFTVPFSRYKVLVEYLGGRFWSEVFDWYDTAVTVPLGTLSVQVSNLGAAVAGAEVALFSEAGAYLGVSAVTEADGSAPFTVPAGTYLLRVEVNGTQYWSGVVHALAHQDNPVTMALDLLALHQNNNPHPTRYDGQAPEYRPMIASVEPLAGLLNRTTINSEATVFYYISDHLTTAQLLVDETGAVVWQGNYRPFGEVDITVNTLDNEFRLPGQYFDTETGLHYNWHRYYDPATGRYITADPIGLDGGMNLYAYVAGNPVNKVDPSGLDFTNKGSKVIWVIKDGSWSKVSPGQTEYGDVDAAVSVPDDADEGCPRKCKAYKWIDCYDALGKGSDGSLSIKLVYCGDKHTGGKGWKREAVCSNPVSAGTMQKTSGGWRDPKDEFGSAPPGCK